MNKNAIKIRIKLPSSQQGTSCNCPNPQEMAVLLVRDQASDNTYRPQILRILQNTIKAQPLSSWMVGNFS